MIPTKTKDLVPEVAESLGIPEEHLGAMYSFYNKELKRILSSMEEINVALPGLGTMAIKGWSIEKEIEKREFRISNSEKEENIAELKRQIELFKAALVKWEKQQKKKKEVRKRKQEHYKNKEANDTERETDISLEEQE